MKILFIDFTKNIGGAELSLLSILKNIESKKKVIAFDKGDFTKTLTEHNIDFIIPKKAPLFLNSLRNPSITNLVKCIVHSFSLFKELIKIAKEYNIVHCQSKPAILIGCILKIFLSKKRFLFHMRDMVDNKDNSTIEKLILRFFLNISKSEIIANSNSTANSLKNIGIKNNIIILYNGIKIPEHIQYAKKDNVFIIGMFSRIAKWKGQHIFIRAAEKLKNYKNIKFCIVGDSLFGEKKYKNKILNYIKKHDLQKKVLLLGNKKDVYNYMNKIDVLALCSIYPEPFGRVIPEAQLLKKAVIATNMGGPKEIIKNNLTGLLIPPSNPDELSKAIIKLYNNKKLYYDITENAVQNAKKNYTEKIMIKNFNKIIFKKDTL